MRDSYQAQLQDLDDKLIVMAKAVQASVNQATQALFTGDIALAEAVISGDDVIDQYREDIEHDAITILATQAPVASDLRQVVTALRVISDVERMGDMSVGIAKVARRRAPAIDLPSFASEIFTKMASIADHMIVVATEVLSTRDLQAARALGIEDDDLDELYAKIFRELSIQSPAADIAVDIAALGRFYERIGDHAVSTADRVIFAVTGEYAEDA